MHNFGYSSVHRPTVPPAAGSAKPGTDAVRVIRCAHVVASIADEAAGPSHSVPALCRALAADRHAVTLVTVGTPPAEARDGFTHRRLRHDHASVPVLRALWRSRALERVLRQERFEVIHSHGLWTLPGVYAALAVRTGAGRHVVAPRGMLDPAALAFAPVKKRVFGALWQRRVLREADMIHATSEAEFEHVRAYGLTAPVAIVPNGIEVPPEPVPAASGTPTVLSLGRIHPKKGLDRLIHAWAELEPAFGDWNLQIVGPDENGHAGELRRLAGALGLRRVTISDPVFGVDKSALYARAALFVLPTRGENFAMTVAESLAMGTPVISTKGAPWAGLVTEGCGWWVDHGSGPLAAAMRHAMALPPHARAQMGRRGRAWMEREFSWAERAGRMAAAYSWLLGEADRPAHVRTEA